MVKNHPDFKLLFSLVVFFMILAVAGNSLAVSFSADMVTVKNGKTETGKFYLLNQYYRLDVLEDGKPMVVIADREKNIHRILNMEEKIFFEISSDDFGVLSNDPFKASEYMVSKYGSKIEGTEKINGINCERQAVIVQNTKIHSRWFSDKLKFPLKLVSYDGGKASYVTELKTIRKARLKNDLFAPPAGFKQVEEPGAATKRKREKQEKQEAALPGLTKGKTDQVPCYVKIAGGGGLRVPIDTDRNAYLDIINEAKTESVYTVLKYRDGKPIDAYEPRRSTLEGKGRHKNWDFNDEFARKTGSSLVDEIRIKVTKGLVYADIRQKGTDRSDVYNRGGWQTDTGADPGRPLTVKITGDNPFGDQTTGKFWLRYKNGGSSEAIPFTVATGKTQTWEYAVEKRIKTVAVTIPKGEGRAKIRLDQPPVPKKAVPDQATVPKKPKLKTTPKAKVVTEFTITHPTGTSKPLTPGKDLAITVTGVSEGARGTVELFSDSKKTKEIDRFNFTLKKNQTQSHFLSGDAHAVWARVWVYKGSFKVKLDQSPNARAVPPPKKKKAAAVTVPKTKKKPATVSAKAQPTASSGLILKGEVPLYKDARVLKSKAYGANMMVTLEAHATPQEIVDFYKQAMSTKGWVPAMAMVQGNKGVLMFKKSSRQLVFKAKGMGDTSKVDITMISQ
jgi:outer membrane lipoprotein-sorting protein